MVSGGIGPPFPRFKLTTRERQPWGEAAMAHDGVNGFIRGIIMLDKVYARLLADS